MKNKKAKKIYIFDIDSSKIIFDAVFDSDGVSMVPKGMIKQAQKIGKSIGRKVSLIGGDETETWFDFDHPITEEEYNKILSN